MGHTWCTLAEVCLSVQKRLHLGTTLNFETGHFLLPPAKSKKLLSLVGLMLGREQLT